MHFNLILVIVVLVTTVISALPTDVDAKPSPGAVDETILIISPDLLEKANTSEEVHDNDFLDRDMDRLFRYLDEINGREGVGNAVDDLEEDDAVIDSDSGINSNRMSEHSLESSTNRPTQIPEKEKPETDEERTSASLTKDDTFTTAVLIAGIAAASLLVLLTIIVLAYLFCGRGRRDKKKNLYLNSDLNRWDPQLLRPSQKHIDAFVFGTPIPSVHEMIKQENS